jgi:hypothetical protein
VPRYPRYASLGRGLRAGGGVILAFGIYALIAGAIVYGLAAGEVFCGPAHNNKSCDPALNASYGLFVVSGLFIPGSIVMLVFGNIYRYRAGMVQNTPRLVPSLALLPAEHGGFGGAVSGLTWRF